MKHVKARAYSYCVVAAVAVFAFVLAAPQKW
jgi:hypothetical protein